MIKVISFWNNSINGFHDAITTLFMNAEVISESVVPHLWTADSSYVIIYVEGNGENTNYGWEI